MRRSLIGLLALALATALAVPTAATASVGSAEDIEFVRPKGPAPSWFTADFAARVKQAGPDGHPLPEEANVPMSSLAFLGIRPGQQIIIDDGQSLALCTANFVFTDGSDVPGLLGASASGSPERGPSSDGNSAVVPVHHRPGHDRGGDDGGGGGGGSGTSNSSFYIGTAGHCGDKGADVYMIFLPLGIARIGTIVQSTYAEDRLAPDFALISIDPALNQWVSPSMAHWGGPTGAFSGSGIQPVVHSGHGLVVGTGGTPRAGVAYQWGDEWRFEGVVTPGDSGSGANIATGLAAGNITHIAVNTREGVPVWMGGTSITKILSLVGGLQLATCSVPGPWPLPGCPPV